MITVHRTSHPARTDVSPAGLALPLALASVLPRPAARAPELPSPAPATKSARRRAARTRRATVRG